VTRSIPGYEPGTGDKNNVLYSNLHGTGDKKDGNEPGTGDKKYARILT
jgi:hypothetical protein